MPRCPHCNAKTLVFKGQNWDFNSGQEVITIMYDCVECGKESIWRYLGK